MVAVKDYGACITKRKSVAIALVVAARECRCLVGHLGGNLHHQGRLTTLKTPPARARQSRGGRFHAKRNQIHFGGAEKVTMWYVCQMLAREEIESKSLRLEQYRLSPVVLVDCRCLSHQ